MWTEVRPATESASGVFVLRSPTTTMCVRAGSNIAVYFRPPDHAMAAVRDRTGSPTISTSGLHSFAYSVPGADAPGWLASRRLPARLARRDGSALAVAGWPSDSEAA